MIAAATAASSVQAQLGAAADLSDTELDDPDYQNQQHQSHNSQQANFLMDKNKKLFPQKLWELINNPSIQHCLRWSDDGQRVYLNRNEFEAYYLKTPNNQFHTQKAISFVRQMNMYGFRKVDDCYYENDNFRRDQQHLLRNMIRRHPNKGLFVTLDHHQLAAAAAAQAQALQVNQHLMHLEAQHKQRAEQALRLSNYLNGAAHHLSQQQQHAASLHQDASRCLANQSPHNIFHLHRHHQQQQQQHPATSHPQHQLQNPSPLQPHHHNHNQQQQQQQQHLSQAAIMQQHAQQQLHSSPFERLNSQALAAAQMAQVAQKLQEQQQQQQQLTNNNHSQEASSIVNQMQQQQHQLNVNAQFRLSKQHQLISNQSSNNSMSKSPPVADLSISKQASNKNNVQSDQRQQLQQMQQQLQMQMRMQPKKSRLLSNFYASNSTPSAAANSTTKQPVDGLSKATEAPADGENHNQSQADDSMQSGESGCSAEASRCSSAAMSQQHQQHQQHQQQQQRLAAMLAAAAAAAANQNNQQHQHQHHHQHHQDQDGPANLSANNKSVSPESDSFSNNNNTLQATNLVLRSNVGAQQQQALHETLVRSLVQLKEQHRQLAPDHHLLASAAFHQHQHQQLNQKTLLESLASLSSAGTNSIVDQSSESAITEERSPSPVASSSQSEPRSEARENLVALNLAKRSTRSGDNSNDADDEDFGIDVCESDQEISGNTNNENNNDSSEPDQTKRTAPNLGQSCEDNRSLSVVSCSMGGGDHHDVDDQFTPLDGARKVEKFLAEDYDCRRRQTVKREADNADGAHQIGSEKRAKFGNDDDEKELSLRSARVDMDASEKGDDDDDLVDIVDAEQVCFESSRAARRLAATQLGINWLSRTLVVQMCDRRGDKLDMEALGDAARYIECFLETLFDDAALIARHQSSSTGENSPESHTSSKDKQSSADGFTTSSSMPIDSSSLSLALKLIPSKLMASVGFHEHEESTLHEDDGVEADGLGTKKQQKQQRRPQRREQRHASRSPPLDEVDICATSGEAC